MAFTNFESQPSGYAGQIARGDQSLSRAWAETNNSNLNLEPGIFIARHETAGVRKILYDTDVIAGITVRAAMAADIKPQEQANLMHIGHGDSIWAQIAPSANVKRGDAVKIVIGTQYAGTITSGTGMATSYIVVRVSGDVAEITRGEI